MVLGQVSSPNVWIDSVQDDVTDISDALVAAQSITSALLHGVRLDQFAKHFDSVHDDVTDISDALVTTQSINQDCVTWCSEEEYTYTDVRPEHCV